MLRKLALLAGGILATSSAFAATISWNTNSAIAIGSGCNSRDPNRPIDTFFVANGNDLSVVFSGLGVNLPGGSGLPLAERKNCSMRVPATLAGGYYVGELTQVLSYGVTKTRAALGGISSRTTFFNAPASPFSVSFPYGSAMNIPLANQTRKDLYLVNTYGSYIYNWCRNPQGIFKSDISVSGQRYSDLEDLIIFSDALDVRFEAIAGLVTCPR